MKQILITAKHSYIGCSLAKWLARYPKEYQVAYISQRTVAWKQTDFSKYDVVVDVTGIAHVDVRKNDSEAEKNYYRVNCDLAVETAELAKKAGVKQFIYMSSMIVYGDSAPIGKRKCITEKTCPKPSGYYGKSKLMAEQKLFALETKSFRVAAVRSPMVYGAGSRGNYPKLARMAKLSPVFPKIANERSMIFIDHLCELIRLIIEHEDRGVFCPQNRETVQSSEMVRLISHTHHLPMILIPGFGGILKALAKYSGYVDKVFGNLTYDSELSNVYENGYQIHDFAETIRITEHLD